MKVIWDADERRIPPFSVTIHLILILTGIHTQKKLRLNLDLDVHPAMQNLVGCAFSNKYVSV